jgi:hypothetical protein
MENERVKEKQPIIEVFGYDAPKAPEPEVSEENVEPEVLDTMGVRHRDVVVSISGNSDGVLYGRTKAEALKYCADILLVAAGENGLEDNIEIVLALQETLQFDYGWKPIKIFEFIRKWKRNLYLKQIGEENRTEENLEEMNKAIGIMNQSKTNTAIGEKIEEQMEAPEAPEVDAPEGEASVLTEEEVQEEIQEEAPETKKVVDKKRKKQ